MTRDACAVLGQQVRQGRIAKNWTVRNLAGALGVSVTTVTRIEKGDPSVAVGSVLEAMIMTGTSPFGADRDELARLRRSGEERVALIPQRVRSGVKHQIDDDF